MHQLLDHLSGTGKDDKGRTHEDYLAGDDTWWENCHGHIQWAFPLPEASKAQPSSPVADDTFYSTVKKSPKLQARMITMTGRYLQFLEQTVLWRRPHDHNHLRITRVIRCLSLCGLNDLAEKVFVYCRTEGEGIVPIETWRAYWREALSDNPKFLPDHTIIATDVLTGRSVQPGDWGKRWAEHKDAAWFCTLLTSCPYEDHAYEVSLLNLKGGSISPTLPVLGLLNEEEAKEWELKLRTFATSLDPNADWVEHLLDGRDTRVATWLTKNGFKSINHIYWMKTK